MNCRAGQLLAFVAMLAVACSPAVVDERRPLGGFVLSVDPGRGTATFTTQQAVYAEVPFAQDGSELTNPEGTIQVVTTRAACVGASSPGAVASAGVAGASASSAPGIRSAGDGGTSPAEGGACGSSGGAGPVVRDAAARADGVGTTESVRGCGEYGSASAACLPASLFAVHESRSGGCRGAKALARGRCAFGFGALPTNGRRASGDRNGKRASFS
jgi:hypothetical protein